MGSEPWWRPPELLNVKTGGTYSYHCALKCYTAVSSKYLDVLELLVSNPFLNLSWLLHYYKALKSIMYLLY
jgi:hypothetical protein